ncbi:MAG TPA: hypothetical protein VNX21_09450 [Candidatus Thermoplasmatota archaeon]|nr:hypothetical protein [Candidatus Thermoplasmatota archaeon]
MKRPPAAYVAVLAVLAVIGLMMTLTFYGVPPFDNLQLFILTNVVGFFTLLVLGVVGGAFVGMLLAHRILASRQFTPFERTVLQGIEDVRARLDALEKRLDEGRPPR